MADKATFYSPTETRVMSALTLKKTRGTGIRGWFRSINAHAEQQGFWAQKNWRLCGDPGPRQWWQRPTGKCNQTRKLKYTFTILASSLLWQFCRRHACSSVAWNILRRTRLHLWVDQWSKATLDQTREEIYLQNGQFRTSCCSRVVIQFWFQLVFYIATAGLIEYISEFSRKITKWPYWQSSIGRPRPSSQNQKQKSKNEDKKSSNEKSIARSPRVVRRVHRQSRRHRSASTPQTLLMTQIRNVLRKWQPGSIVFILTSHKTEIAKAAREPRLQGLLAEGELVIDSVPRAEKLVT